MPGELQITPRLRIPASELEYRFTRSAGPGGQHVNKVSTRVEILFIVADSAALTEAQKGRIMVVLKHRISSEGSLKVSAQDSRSQWKNRRDAEQKLVALLQSALRPSKQRIATTPSHVSKAARLQEKKLQSAKKRLRQTFRDGRD